MIKDIYKLLASVAVVGDLYDNQKGIYDVLKEFVLDIISREKLRSFSVTQITRELNTEYGFRLNEPVVKTCLKGLGFSSTNGVFTYKVLPERKNSIQEPISEYERKTTALFDDLCKFIEKETKTTLSSSRAEAIKDQFCDFLMDRTVNDNDSNSRIFNQYILLASKNDERMEIINNIREGILVYEGIRYCSNVSETGSWKTEINIFLDTEMLFAACKIGNVYNAELFEDLRRYLSEINSANKNRVHLWYFPETKVEFKQYFDRAESIVRGKDTLDITKEAMCQIVNGCSFPSDVQQKKTAADQAFKSLEIKQFNTDMYEDTEINKRNNLESMELLEKYSTLWRDSANKDSIFTSMRYLSHINKLRHGISNNGFENCGYVFLTATGRTLKLSMSSDFHNEGEVPLATSLDFLINKFWFKLNKGFGINKSPRTVDMVLKAKQVLSSIISNRAAVKYEEYKKKYEQDEITKEEFVALNSDLRSKLVSPEDIDGDTITEDFFAVDKWDFVNALEAQRKKQADYDNAMNTISSLENKMSEMSEASEAAEKSHSKVLQEYQEKLLKTEDEKKDALTELLEKTNELNEKDIELKRYREKEEKRKKRRKVLAYVIGGIVVLVGVAVYIFGLYYDYKWTRIVSGILTIAGIVVGVAGIKDSKKSKK